jgi:hypothetical protein
MTIEDIVFVACNVAVAPVWLLMVFAPGWSATEKLARSLVVPLGIALGYLVVVLSTVGSAKGHFFSLEGIELLFSDRRALLAGWIHYLAFDLVVGSWIYRDARGHGLAHRWLVPCLVFTLMYGPIGLLGYAIVRRVKTDGRPLLA